MPGSGKPIVLGTLFGFLAGGLASTFLVGAVIACIVWQPSKLANWVASHQTFIATTDNSDTVFTPATSDEAVVVATVEQAKPAVVSIVASADVPIFEEYYADPGSIDPFGFDPFSRMMPQYRQKGTEKQDVSSGSGFVVSADGYIVTNKHVVDNVEASYAVFLNDGTKYDATVVARDPSNDIAILKIEAANLTYLQFGDSDAVQVGQTAIAIGNALGEFNNSVSVGVISGIARSIEAGDGMGMSEVLDNVLQTDAAINQGNSGGPLLDSHGRVIGMNVAVALNSENIGFALPGNLMQSVVEMVKTNGTIVRPYLGVRYTEITPAIQQKNNLAVDYGVLIRSQAVDELAVIPGSPADQAGLRENDIILEVDGKKLDDTTSLSTMIAKKNVGDTVELSVLQQGEEKTVQATLQARPDFNISPTTTQP